MSEKMRFCTQCGTRADEGDLFCARCGAKLKSPAPTDISDNADSSRAVSHIPVSDRAVSGSTEPSGAVAGSAVQGSNDSGSSGSSVPTASHSAQNRAASGGTGSSRPAADHSAHSKTETGSAVPDKSVSRGSISPGSAPKKPVPVSPPPKTPVQQAEKPRSRARSILITVLIIALGGLAGKLIAGQLVNGYQPKATSTKSPIVTVRPAAEVTKAPLRTITDAPAVTRIPTSTPLPTIVITAPDVSSLFENIGNDSKQTYWDYLQADDSEILDAMTNFWCGYDSSTGAKCAFFTDRETKHGGFYWYILTENSIRSYCVIGTFIRPQENSNVLVDADGEETPVTLIKRKDGGIDFNFGSGENIKGTLRLKKSNEYKEQVKKLIFNYKHALEKMR